MAKAITANNWDDVKAMQTIPYFLQNTTDAWYQSLAVKPQNFNEFKTEFLQYFSNNNSINKLANTFTTIRQGNTKAVTTYLECFHRNLHQIQAIQADYFIAPQILNQFIRGLGSSILQQVRPIHPVDLPTAVTYTRNFEAAKLKANHTQAVNLAMNRSSELDSKLKQFSDSINQKLEGYLADTHMIYQLPQRYNNQENANCFQNQSHPFLLVTSEDTTSNNQKIEQQQPPTNNIPLATITKNEFLDAIFLFKLKEPSDTPLFSRTALEKKPIMAMYTNVKVTELIILPAPRLLPQMEPPKPQLAKSMTSQLKSMTS
ncbi:hypothetical protein G9A89_019062 [Geosiphon pyriformis]|nr:hypothetical protein G9A89_019062 [Geosiphon pyriformis]